MKDLEQFDKLSADITLFVAPALKVEVTDVDSSAHAIEVAKQLKGFLTAVDKKRKELVGPLNDKVKAINEYAKKITAPLDQADSHIRTQLNCYATEQEKLRRAEEERINKEREEIERNAREEREREEEALRIKQEAEAEDLARGAALFGIGHEEIETVNKEIDERLSREWAEKQAELARKEAIQKIEHSQKAFDVRQMNISGARETWFCEATDMSQVPKEFLIVTLNEKAVIAAAKAGAKIPGVKTWTEMRVPIGAKTRAAKLIG